MQSLAVNSTADPNRKIVFRVDFEVENLECGGFSKYLKKMWVFERFPFTEVLLWAPIRRAV